jgi:hypothetical protein
MPHDTQSSQLQRILFKFYQKYLRFGEILSTVVAGLVSVIAPQQRQYFLYCGSSNRNKR